MRHYSHLSGEGRGRPPGDARRREGQGGLRAHQRQAQEGPRLQDGQ